MIIKKVWNRLLGGEINMKVNKLINKNKIKRYYILS